MKTTLILFILSTVFALHAYGQDKTIEQIKNELKGHPQQDTVRVNRLLELSSFDAIPFIERQNIAYEALALSRKISYQVGEGYALTRLGGLELRQGNEKKGDSLLQLANSIANKIEDPELTGIISYRRGLQSYGRDNKTTLGYMFTAEKAFTKAGSKRRLSDCQRLIGELYLIQLSNYPASMEYLLKAIHSAEESNFYKGLVDSWITLGNLYTLIGDYENGIIYLQKAGEGIKKYKGSNDQNARLQNGLGEAYRFTKKYPEAIRAYELSNKYDSSINNIALNESNIADVYTQMDSLSLAFQYAFRSFEVAKELDNIGLVSWLQGVLARAYLKKGLPDSAIYFAKAGLNTAIQTGTIEFMRDNAASLSNAYALKKDFANAYNYELRFINYRDSMLSTEVKNKTAVLRYNNDLEKKQAQIGQLNSQKKAQQTMLISALVVLALIAITTILLLRNNRQKQKANSLLQKQKQEIDDKANELLLQKESLEQSYSNVELLGEIGRKITSSLSVEAIIDTAYDNVNSLMDASVFGIGIFHEEKKSLDFPSTYENGQSLPPYSNSISDKTRLAAICFNSGNEILIGNLDAEYQVYLQSMPVPNHGNRPLSLIYLPLKVNEKMLGVITVQSFKENAFSDYHLYMLRNIAIYAAIAIENAESFNKLNITVDSLKNTQTQLIQSEKMASLGELTAGIAHEIQNPLNFVNNFSEINRELISELMLGISEANYDEVKLIATNIEANETKIMHHGKRADAIVKGMLQHSRTSSSVKEPTDINALTDEYLRLSYHGLRARDKNFNAAFTANLDPAIGKINIIPQEIGRVLLNIINNAFYATHEKKKLRNGSYEPGVIVETIQDGDKIKISVKDNGMGIPAHVKEKIFQPFFTTKPTGEGTGLGLSISYDIVKAHGGEFRVETKEGEGSEFTIEFPFG